MKLKHIYKEPRPINPGAMVGLVFIGVIMIGKVCGYLINLINQNYLGK